MCPGTYFGILIKKKVEVIKSELRPPAHFLPAAVVHITARASKHAVLCASPRAITLIIDKQWGSACVLAVWPKMAVRCSVQCLVKV